jgi:hypothetical protein
MGSRVALVGAGLLLLGGIVLALWPTAKHGGFSEVLSSRRADALGTKALFEVLERTGHRPVRRTEDLESIQVDGVLLLLNPEAPRPPLPGLPVPHTFSRHEVREVARWVENGGRLVVVSSRNTRLHREFGVRVIDEDRAEPHKKPGKRRRDPDWSELLKDFEELLRRPAPEEATRPGVARATGSSPLQSGARELRALRFHHFDLPASDRRTLFAHAKRAVALVVPRGRGLAVFVSTPYLASNVGLREADNLRFLHGMTTLLSGERGIHFDEYHHGQRRDRGFMALLGAHRLHFAVGQIGLAFLLWVWSAQRPRRQILARGPRARGAGEHLAAMANLYERGRLTSFAAAELWSATLGALASRLRLRGARTVRAMAEALAARGRADLARRLWTLERRRAAHGARIRERELLSFAQELARLRLAVELRTHPSSSEEIRR